MIRLLSFSLLLALVSMVVAQKDEPAPSEISKVKPTLVIDPGNHISRIREVFFLPDGKQAVSYGNDHTVRLWDLTGGKADRVIHPPGRFRGEGDISRIAMSGDGKLLAVPAVHNDKGRFDVIHLLSLPEGKLVRTVRPPEKDRGTTVIAIALSHDGDRIAWAQVDPAALGTKKSPGIRVLDLAEQDDKVRLILPKTVRAYDLAFSRDGKRLAWATERNEDNNCGIYDLDKDKPLATFRGDGNPRLAWRADGKMLAVGTLFYVRLFDEVGTGLGTMKFPSQCNTLAFHPDGEAILWNGKIMRELPKQNGAPEKNRFAFTDQRYNDARSGAISSDGKRIATVLGNANLIIREAVDKYATLRQVRSTSWIAEADSRGWSKDGAGICWHVEKAAKSSRKHGLFHLGNLELLPPPKEGEVSVGQITKQGELSLETLGKGGKIESGDESKVMQGAKMLARPTGTWATFAGKDRVATVRSTEQFGIAVYDALTGKMLLLQTGQSSPFFGKPRLTPSPDGRYLLTQQVNQTLSIWAVEQPGPLLTLYVNGSDWIIWTKEGYYAATPGGEKMVFWRVDNGIDKMPLVYAADRFKKKLHRPDVIKKAFELGSVSAALEALDGKGAKVDEIETILPPIVELKIVKQEGRKVTVKVTARAQAKSQPVVALRLMLNGMPFPDLPAVKGKTEHEWTVDLTEGRHTLGALARSEDSSARAEPIAVAWRKPANLPVLHVVAVGINKYPNGIPALKCATNDATDVESAFKKVRGDKTRIFRDVKTHLLTDDKAKAKDVLTTLQNLNPQRDDIVVVFLAGHGTLSKGDFFFLTTDSDPDVKKLTDDNALSGKKLAKSLCGLGCRTLLLLDTRHSGAAELKTADDAARVFSDDEVGVTVMSAAMGKQKALEDGSNGLFTHAIKEALADTGKKRAPRDDLGRLFTYHLFAHVSERVGEMSDYKQTPFLRLPDGVSPFALRQFEKK